MRESWTATSVAIVLILCSWKVFGRLCSLTKRSFKRLLLSYNGSAVHIAPLIPQTSSALVPRDSELYQRLSQISLKKLPLESYIVLFSCILSYFKTALLSQFLRVIIFQFHFNGTFANCISKLQL